MTSDKPVYFKNLDGLRFFAFLAVFISHAALFIGYNSTAPFWLFVKRYILVNGDVGVSFFFVLSGFLITYLLFKEKDNHGRISLKNFYARRILRIWPVYFITLIVGFFLLPIIVGLFSASASNPSLLYNAPPFSVLPFYLFFLANFSLAFHGGASVPTDVLWSISVEEQFYLVWPWIIAFFPRRHLLKFIGGIILISTIYRYFNASSLNVIAYSTFSVMSDLAIGSALAIFTYTKSHTTEKVRSFIRSISGAKILCVYIFMFALVFTRHLILDAFNQSGTTTSIIFYNIFTAIIPLLLALTYAFIIFEQNESTKSLFKIGKLKTVTFLGKISYGLYSYHVFAFIIVLLVASTLGFSIEYTSPVQWIIFAILSLLSVFILAVISYYGIERWFLKAKPKD
jgi:peptidoglycan/LPS O-acetylase OafA/YrhL